MAKYKYDPLASEKVFNDMFGEDAYQNGMRQAMDIGRRKGEAERLGAIMKAQQKEAEKKAKEAAKKAEKEAKKKAAENALIAGLDKPGEKKKKSGGMSLAGIGKGVMNTLEIIDRPGDAIRSGIKEAATGGNFLTGAKEGFTGKTNTSGEDLLNVLGMDPKKSKIASGAADVLGMGMKAITPGGGIGYPLLGMDDKKIGMSTAGAVTEMALDPTNLLGLGVLSKATKGVGRLARPFARAADAVSEARPANELLGLPAPAPEAPRQILGLPAPAEVAKAAPPAPAPTLGLPAPGKRLGESLNEAGLGFGFNGRNVPPARTVMNAPFGRPTVEPPALSETVQNARVGFGSRTIPQARRMAPLEGKPVEDQVIEMSADDLLYEMGQSLKKAKEEGRTDVRAGSLNASVEHAGSRFKNEFDQAVNDHIEYLKNSMGKGADGGTTSNGLDGNFKEVTGTFRVSKNPQWYQDFLRIHKRRPNKAELRALAEDHVRNGFTDEFGTLPPFMPKEVQSIDDQIQEVQALLREQPEMEGALRPVIQGLIEDKATMMDGFKRVLDGPPATATEAPRPALGDTLDRSFNPSREPSMDPMANPRQIPMPKTAPPKRSALEEAGLDGRFNPKNAPSDLPFSVNHASPDFMGRPAAYWRTRYEDFADYVQKAGYTSNTLSRDALQELWTQFAKTDEPFSLEQVVDMAYPPGSTFDAPTPRADIPARDNFNVDPQFAREEVPSRPLKPNIPEPPVRDNLQFDPLNARETVPRRPQRIRTGMPEDYKVERVGVRRTAEEQAAIKAEREAQTKEQLMKDLAEWEQLRKLWGPKDPANIFSSSGWNGPKELFDRFLELKNKFGKPMSEQGIFEGLKHPPTRDEFKNILTPKGAPEVKPGNSSGPFSENLGAIPGSSGPATPITKGIDWQGTKTARAQIETPISKAWNSMSKSVLDKTAYVKYIENKIKGIGRFKGEGSLYQKLTNVKGASGATERYVNQNLMPALDAIEKDGGSRSAALEYVYAHNILETAKNVPGYQLPKGTSLKDYQDTVDMFKNEPAYENFRQSMQTYWHGLQDELVDAGWLSRKQVDEMRKKYPNYMPKFRQQDLEDPEQFERAFSQLFEGRNTKNPVHTIKEGSEEKLGDPIENILKATQNIHYAVLRNKAMQHLEDIADQPIFGKTVAVKRVKRPEEAENLVRVRFNGKEQLYDVHKEMAEALTSVKDVLNLDPAMRFLAKAATNQRRLVTGNAVFTVRNILRDVWQGFNVSDNDLRFLAELPAAFMDIVTNGKRSGSMLDDFYKHGAGNSTVWANDRKVFEAMQRRAYGKEYSKGFKTFNNFNPLSNVMAKMFDAMSKFNDAGDQIPKLAEFRASVKNGKSMDEAAFNARDLMDFQKSGASVQKINRYVAFVNANIRGKEKYMRAFANNPVKTTLKGAVTGFIPSLLAYEAYNTIASDKQKRMIDESPAWLRDTFWLLPDPTSDNIIRIPKPFDVSAIFSAPFEYYMRHENGLSTDTGAEVRDWLMNNLFINPSLNPITPFIEAGTNKDFMTGGQIVPGREIDRPKGEQQDVYTSEPAKWIAGAIGKSGVFSNTAGASPRVVDHILKGVFPGAGEASLNSFDRLLEEQGVRANQKPENNRDSPLDALMNVGRQFVVPAEGSSAFSTMDEMYTKQKDLKNLKADQEAKYGDGNWEFPSVYKYLNKVVAQKRKYDAAIREVDNDPKRSPSEKKQLRNQLIEQRNQLVRNLKDQGFLSKDKAVLKQLEPYAETLLDSME